VSLAHGGPARWPPGPAAQSAGRYAWLGGCVSARIYLRSRIPAG